MFTWTLAVNYNILTNYYEKRIFSKAGELSTPFIFLGNLWPLRLSVWVHGAYEVNAHSYNNSIITKTIPSTTTLSVRTKSFWLETSRLLSYPTYTNLVFISSVRSSRKNNHDEINKKSASNGHKHGNVATLSKICKLSKNFVEVDWIRCLYEVPTKGRQMITTAHKVSGVWLRCNLQKTSILC